MKAQKVIAIILNYNHIEDLKETITSFLLQDYPNLHIVVSDNGSEDQSVSWLKKNCPLIHILENKENLGWAEGNNVGIKYAQEQNADYILLANNDLYFENPTLISDLIKQVENNSKLIIGPKQNFYYESEKNFSRGHFFMNISTKGFNSIREKTSSLSSFPHNLEIVDYIAGSFVLFNVELINDIGYIDPAFYLYGEDADFFLRAWKKGYISLVDNNHTILHKVSATSGIQSPTKGYYQSRNIWLNLRKHKDITNHLYYFKKLATLSILKNIVKSLLKLKLKLTASIIIGFWHGFVLKKYFKYY